MSVPRSRMLDLMKVQCQLYSHTFNPEGIRTGNKVLRQRLRGPALVSYYPRKVATFRDLIKEFEPLQLTADDEFQDDRLESIAGLKSRGKGKPTKKKTGSAPDPKGKKR